MNIVITKTGVQDTPRTAIKNVAKKIVEKTSDVLSWPSRNSSTKKGLNADVERTVLQLQKKGLGGNQIREYFMGKGRTRRLTSDGMLLEKKK